MSPIILEPPAVGNAEGIQLDGLDLNDQTDFSLEGLGFSPAKKLLEWIKGADSDGSKLLRIARHENSEFDLRVRVKPQVLMDDALDSIGAVKDKLQEAERQAANGGRGLPLVWTPTGSTYSFTFYVQTGEIEVPKEIDGQDQGWLRRFPVVNIKLYCSPFGYGEEVVEDTVTSSDPLVIVEVEDVPGDVPAEARIIVTDGATQSRPFLAAGLENVHYDAATSLLLDSDSMVVSGLAGFGGTRTGAYDVGGGNTVVRAVLTTNPVAVCSSPELTHIGTFRNRFRLWPSSKNISVRLAWRQGRDQWTTEPFAQAPFEDAFWEPDLGLTKIREALLGTQTWQWRIEAKSTAPGDELDVDYHAMIPAGEGYGQARTVVTYQTPTAFSARDEFEQTAGALAGKSLAVGGSWSGVGDTTDFAVETTGKTAERTAVSDTGTLGGTQFGRFAISGVSAFAAQFVQVDFKQATLANYPHMGVVCRYVDTSNWLTVYAQRATDATKTYITVEKCVAGVFTELAAAIDVGAPPIFGGVWYTLAALVDASGVLSVWMFSQGAPGPVLWQTQDSALATGGALASGKPGIVDELATAGAVTRNYDNFFAFAPAADAVILSGQSAEFRSYGDDPVLREDSTGTYWGRPSETRGGRLWLPPAGDEGRTTRIAVMARRSDVETLPSANIADSTSVAVAYRSRWVDIPRQA